MSLYRKWRPVTFADVLGQAHVTETLVGAIRDDRLSHAYLFSGPRGTGKTSTARILAKSLNCETSPGPTPCGECGRCREISDGTSLDVMELDAASHTSVDDVREIRERIPYVTAGGGRKVYIIDEAHQLSNPAFNALLKMLEEPPGHVVFVLCTTEPHKLPATVISRCQRFEFRRMGSDVLTQHVTDVASKESIDVDEAAVALIVRHARGSARDALALLDQAASTAVEGVTRQTILEILGEAPEDVLLDIAEAVAEEDIIGVFDRVERTVEQGWDPRQLLVQLLEEFRALFLAQRGVDDTGEVDPEHAERRRQLSQRFTSAHLEWVLQALADGQADMRLSTHPRLTLEVALARGSNLEVRETQTVVARLERLERAMLQGAKGAPAAAPRPVQRPAPKPDAPAEPKAAPAATPAQPQAPDPEPQPTAPAAAPAKADGPLGDRWLEVMEAVRKRSRVAHTHLREAEPVAMADGQVKVIFAKEFHATEITSRPKLIEAVTAALKDVFGTSLRLKAEVDEGAIAQTSEPDGSTDPVDLVRDGLGAEVVKEGKA